MTRSLLIAASTAALIATGALAQTTAPAPTDPARPTAPMTSPTAPAAPRAAPTEEGVYLAPGELTSDKIVGITIYAPKADGSAAAPATGSTATTTPTDPATTGSTAVTAPSALTVSPVNDEDWRSMRDRYDNIGKVNDLVIGTDGRLSHAVIGVGGFLGIGEKAVSLELKDVRLMRAPDGTLFGVVMRNKEQLQAMPRFMGERRT